MSTTIQEYAKAKKIRIHQAKAIIKAVLGDVPAMLTDEDIQIIESSNQQQVKALPQVQIAQTEQTEQFQPQLQPEQSQPQEEQPMNDAPAPIQTTSNNDIALTQSDLAAIVTIRETFGEQGVQVFLQKKRQDLIVNRATTDALRQHDEQKLYEDVKLSVQNQLQIRDYIQEQQALDMAITQHTQLKAQRKEKIQKSNEAFDTQLSEFLTKQQDFNSTMELLGISML